MVFKSCIILYLLIFSICYKIFLKLEFIILMEEILVFSVYISVIDFIRVFIVWYTEYRELVFNIRYVLFI